MCAPRSTASRSGSFPRASWSDRPTATRRVSARPAGGAGVRSVGGPGALDELADDDDRVREADGSVDDAGVCVRADPEFAEASGVSRVRALNPPAFPAEGLTPPTDDVARLQVNREMARQVEPDGQARALDHQQACRGQFSAIIDSDLPAASPEAALTMHPSWGDVVQFEAEHLAHRHHTQMLQAFDDPCLNPLIPAASGRGRRTGRIGHSLVENPPLQRVDQLVENDTATHPRAVAPPEDECPPPVGSGHRTGPRSVRRGKTEGQA